MRRNLNLPSREHDSTPAETPSSPTSLMTIRQVAELLGCSLANVYGLIDSGELPVISIGTSRGYRVDRQDLEDFLSRRKSQKAAAQAKAPRPKLKHIRLP